MGVPAAELGVKRNLRISMVLEIWVVIRHGKRNCPVTIDSAYSSQVFQAYRIN